jgi:peroxiredoxin
MRPITLALAACVALGSADAAVAQTAKPTPTAAPAPLAPGTTAPDFDLKGWDGAGRVKLSSFRAQGDQPGKVVVIDFWCLKCPGSRKYEAALSAMTKAYAAKGVEFIAIDANGTSSVEELRTYIADQAVAMRVVRDQNFATADAFGALVTPHCYVIDRQGVIRYVGAVDNRRPADDPRHVPHLANAIDAVLAGTDVPAATTRAFG